MSRIFPQSAWIALIYLSLLLTYYSSAHLFVQYCTPSGFLGFIQSPFLVETLQCRGLKWIFTYSHEYIRSLWLLISTYAVKVIMDFFSQLKEWMNGTTSTNAGWSLQRK